MRKILAIGVSTLVAAGLLALAWVAWTCSRQGPEPAFWTSYKTASVRFDSHGIPTVEAPDWQAITEAQGFVVASQRLFQMDLIRRQAGGRLAEWFGEAAYAHDAAVQAEDRLALAARDAALLPPDEKAACDAYARGVNAFIQNFPGRWGVEYVLLRVVPEPWSCADSLLVVLAMTEKLTSLAESEAQQWAWKRNLSPAWQDFLFSDDHPWNHPYFGTPSHAIAMPPAAEALPAAPLPAAPGSGVPPDKKEARVVMDDPVPIGSNNWAWRGATGAFLANDPHLGTSVPQIWYALRLKRAKDDWAVGVALPGLPGITLGMNPALAWAFTNTGEDVDDFLQEKVSPDGRSYVERIQDGQEVWAPIVKKTFAVKVKGEPAPRRVEALFTRRGPLAKRQYLGAGLYSRQWLSLKDGMLRIPADSFRAARTLHEADAALDGMTAPAQNVLIMTRDGDLGYRMSGTGVRRRVTGRIPQPAVAGEWLGFEPPAQRRRLFYEAEPPTKTRYLATANERVWIDPFGGSWFSDDRKERIVRVLAAREDFKREDMEALQLDTQSRFRKLLLDWIAARASTGDEAGLALARQWRRWDGDSRTDPLTFAQSTLAEDTLESLLLARVQATFKSAEDRQVPYKHHDKRAWVTAVLLAPGDSGLAPFGVTAGAMATYLLRSVVAHEKEIRPHQLTNLWGGQHPFVGRVPVVGSFFAIDAYPQWGAYDLVLAERPSWGPSMRLVWDLRRPWESTWTFPVGQSGHVRSEHYADFHRQWATGERLKVFDDADHWRFPGRSP